MEYYISIKYKV